MSLTQIRVGPTAGEDTQPWKAIGSIRKKSAGRRSGMLGSMGAGVRCALSSPDSRTPISRKGWAFFSCRGVEKKGAPFSVGGDRGFWSP